MRYGHPGDSIFISSLDGDTFHTIMRLPLVNLAPWLVSVFSPDRDTAPSSRYLDASPAALAAESSSLSFATFRPIHALGHTHSNTSSPRLIIHNATSAHSLTHQIYNDIGTLHALPSSEQEEYLLDHPNPEIAARPLSIRTKRMLMRRPRIRPPGIISWALSAQTKRRGLQLSSLDYATAGLPPGTGAGTGAGAGTWVAPDYDDHHGWEDIEVTAPDVSDRQTLITMAKMASNAYVVPDGGEWWPLDQWNNTTPFGWEPDADGLRGHVVSFQLTTFQVAH